MFDNHLSNPANFLIILSYVLIGESMNFQRLVAVLLVCAFLFGCTGTSSQVKTENKTLDPLAQKYLDSITYGVNNDAYEHEYSETIGNYTQHYSLAITAQGKKIAISTVLFNRSIFIEPNNMTTICVASQLSSECVSAGNDTKVQQYISQLSTRFFNTYSRELERTRSEQLYQKEALLLTDLGTKTLGGQQCVNLGIEIDYQRLTIKEAKDLGIPTTGPQHFTGSACIREDGLAIEKSFEYEYNGKLQQTHVFEVSYAKNPVIAFPAVTSNDSAFDLLSFVSDIERGHINCLSQKDVGQCMRMLAVDNGMPPLCNLANDKKDDCYSLFAELHKNPVYCESVQVMDMRENCYGTIAQIYGNQTYCGNINNASKYQLCLNVSQIPYERPRQYRDTPRPQGSSEIPDFLLPYLK